MNAFQMEKLLHTSIKENRVIEDWVSKLNELTHDAEYKLT